MTTPNEQPVSQTPRTGYFEPTGEHQICARCFQPVNVENGDEWEDGDICHRCGHELFLEWRIYRAELEAVARAAIKQDNEYTPGARLEEDLDKNCELKTALFKAISALKAKGFKP